MTTPDLSTVCWRDPLPHERDEHGWIRSISTCGQYYIVHAELVREYIRMKEILDKEQEVERLRTQLLDIYSRTTLLRQMLHGAKAGANDKSDDSDEDNDGYLHDKDYT